MAAGARNLLVSCVGLRAGDRLLILREDSRHGYYDAAALCVAAQAEVLGAEVETVVAPLIDGPEDFPENLRAAMERADETIFFSRIGDQLRFRDLPGGGGKTMCYALDAEFLSSRFSTLPHELMEGLWRCLETELDSAREWRITCPLGSDVSGCFEGPPAQDENVEDFTLRLFPVTTFRPVPCATMTGRVAVAHWLMATGTHAYEPFAVTLEEPVFAVVDRGRIRDFQGPPDVVKRVRAHYDMVAAKFDLNRDLVHSWHAGINPQTFYPRPALQDLERWGGVSFGSPRYLHFHTCGDYAPGEIAWSLFDATVRIDGETWWDRGQFTWLERPDNRTLVARYPDAEDIFEMRTDIGI